MPIIVVIPCVGDDILGRPQHYRFREKNCNVITMGAAAWIPQSAWNMSQKTLTRFISGDNNTIILYAAILLTEHVGGDDDSGTGIKFWDVR